MPDLHPINVAIHIGAGALALAIGLAPLFSRKGSEAHRGFGRAFVAVGAVVLGTACIGNIFFDPPPPLIAATVAAGYQYVSSLRALALRESGPSWIDALIAMAGLAGAATLLVYMGSGTKSWSPAIGYSTLGFTAAIALYDLSRHFWRATWLKHARPLDHGLKMTGAYFAMMSAGVGNVFRDFQPWSQVGPSVLGVFAMAAVAFAYLRVRRAQAA
jgi:hypothetical protein